jgi:hypothetical protein
MAKPTPKPSLQTDPDADLAAALKQIDAETRAATPKRPRETKLRNIQRGKKWA